MPVPLTSRGGGMSQHPPWTPSILSIPGKSCLSSGHCSGFIGQERWLCSSRECFVFPELQPRRAGLCWCCEQDWSRAMTSRHSSQDFALQSQRLLRPSGHTGQATFRPFIIVWGAQVVFKLSEKSSLQTFLILHHWKHLIIFKTTPVCSAPLWIQMHHTWQRIALLRRAVHKVNKLG